MEIKRYKNFARKMANYINRPPEADADIVKVTIICDDEMIIRNFGRIYDYTDKFAAFVTDRLLIEVNGSQLLIENVSAHTVRITGKIESVVYTRVRGK